MADLNLERARDAMTRAGFDALLIVEPENFYYATGFSSMLAYLHMPGFTSLAILPTDASRSPAAIVADTETRALRRATYIQDVRSHRTWIESIDLTRHRREGGQGPAEADLLEAMRGEPQPRPADYNQAEIMDLLHAILQERGFLRATIGVELEGLPVSEYQRLQACFPEVQFKDSSFLLRELRLVKTPSEIARLRQAVELTEVGLEAACQSVGPETVAGQIFNVYQKAILDRVARDGLDDAQVLTKGVVRIGWEPWVGTGWSQRLKPGDQIQFDVGLRYRGYRSDLGRSYSFQEVTPAQRRIYIGLRAAHDAALEQIRPGKRFSDAFAAAMAAARGAGLRSYTRGHIGHGLGLDQGEEWPYISAGEQRLFEPGQVLAVETPLYVDGIGGFQIEQDVLVTSSGCESLGRLSLDMRVLGID